MEQRDKKARLNSLAELKRLRTEGGSRSESLELGIDKTVSNDEIQDDYEDDGFIEPEERSKRPAVFAFKPKINNMIISNNDIRNKETSKTALEGDEYFKNLMSKMEAEFDKEDAENDDDDDDDNKKEINVMEEKKSGLNNGLNVNIKDSNNNPLQIITKALSKEPSISSLGLASSPFYPDQMQIDTSIPEFLPTITEPILSSEFAPAESAFDETVPLVNSTSVMERWFDEIEFDDDDYECGLVKNENGKDIDPLKLECSTLSPADQERGDAISSQIDHKGFDSPSIDSNAAPPLNSNAPVIANSTTIQVGQPIQFYWLDAYEKSNGVIYLFGKVALTGGKGDGSSFVSCCVTINNMKRNLFFLPRETLLEQPEQEVTLGDVHGEIGQLAVKYKIGKFGCKKVARKYAFELADIPIEADYIKMVYPFTVPALPKDLASGNSFSHVFGLGTSALELFLIKRKIMGPCWLQLTPQSVSTSRSISWCKLEITVDNPKTIIPIINGPSTPPLTALSLAIRTVVEPQSKTHEVVSASGLVFNTVPVESNSSSGDKSPKCTAVFSVARDKENLGFTDKFIAEATKAYGASGGGGGKVELVKNERSLLSYLISMIYRADPDVIVGHNFLGFDLGVLLHRMKACKVDFWSRLGRLNWSQWPKARPGSTEASYAERQIASGRLIVDTYVCAKDLVKSRNYSLQTLVETQLQQTREEFDYERVGDYFVDSQSLVHLIRHCEKDAFYGAMLMFQLMILPLTKQLTNIAGNLWSRTLTGGRAERNEFLLLHEFHRLKYICPDKSNASSTMMLPTMIEEDSEIMQLDNPKGKGTGVGTLPSTRRKPTYAGGLVLEPKKGLYSNIVLLLDFNSLYPSIIQEYNICFTTVERTSTNALDDTNNINDNSNGMPDVPEPGTLPGVLPKILANLVARRREIKRLMKNPKLSPSEHVQLHIRQQALKLTANSMYGCLGFAHSRFHARALAMLITGKGREILQNTVDIARNQCRLDVIYGDTDSVMVHTGTRDLKDAKAMAMILKKAVNEKYRLLEIELDGIFERLLLLKKKKYAAVILEEDGGVEGGLKKKIETKGLDLVRRDWSALSVDTSNDVLEKILADPSVDGGEQEDVVDAIHGILQAVASKVIADTIPLEKYIISKNLTKEPEQYSDAKTQPHVMVALRLRERGLTVKAGDTIPYIICGDEDTRRTGSLADYAFHPDDVRRDHLSIAKDWYLAQQIHPCVSRLCEHLPGTDSARIASCLGLDPSKYQSRTVTNGNNNGGLTGGAGDASQLSVFMDKDEKFKHCRPLCLTCVNCNAQFECKDLTKIGGTNNCSTCSQKIPIASILYQIRVAVHKDIAQYYEGWMECDEAACRARTRQPRVYDGRCINDTCRGSMNPVISGHALYTQLQYYRYVADIEEHNKQATRSELKSLLIEVEPVKEFINLTLAKCAFPVVNLAEIFSFVTIKSS